MARREVGRLGLAEITVEVSAVRFLQPRAQAEVRELEVAPSVQQEIIRLDISARKEKGLRLGDYD